MLTFSFYERSAKLKTSISRMNFFIPFICLPCYL